MALMKEEPWEDIEQSYLGGLWERSCHRRTVASLEAERTNFGFGKTTPRTYKVFVNCIHRHDSPDVNLDAYIIFVLFKRNGKFVVGHTKYKEVW